MASEILRGMGRIGFIGVGNMAEAFIGAPLRSKPIDPPAILVSDVSTKRLKACRRISSQGFNSIAAIPRL